MEVKKDYKFDYLRCDKLTKRWNIGTDIGIYTGDEHGNLLVIDVDSKDIPIEVFNIGAPIVSTPRGYHIYIIYETGFSRKKRNGNIDIITNYAYVIHPPTEGYKLIGGSFDNIPIMRDEAIDKLVDFINEK